MGPVGEGHQRQGAVRDPEADRLRVDVLEVVEGVEDRAVQVGRGVEDRLVEERFDGIDQRRGVVAEAELVALDLVEPVGPVEPAELDEALHRVRVRADDPVDVLGRRLDDRRLSGRLDAVAPVDDQVLVAAEPLGARDDALEALRLTDELAVLEDVELLGGDPSHRNRVLVEDADETLIRPGRSMSGSSCCA